MNLSTVYIVIGISALVIIAILALLLSQRKGSYKLTPLAGVAFAFVLAGILFGENRWLGYGLMGVGIILAVVDIILRSRKGA